MKKRFEEPNMRTFLLASDDIMDVLSTEMIPYDPSTENSGSTEPEFPDEF